MAAAVGEEHHYQGWNSSSNDYSLRPMQALFGGETTSTAEGTRDTWTAAACSMTLKSLLGL